MSIQTQLDRITGAKSAIRAAIIGKGVDVPTDTMIDGMAPLILEIEGGGEAPPATDDGYGNIVISDTYSYVFTDDGFGNLTGTTVTATATDDDGNITLD